MKNNSDDKIAFRIGIKDIPITTNTFNYPRISTLLLILLHTISLLMPSVFIMTFFQIALNSNFFHWRILLIFIDIFAWWGLYLLVSLIIGKLLLILLSLLHKPKEGLFEIGLNNNDYLYFCLRFSIKKFIFWIWNNFAFPWVSNFAFKLCNMSVDFKSTLFDGWSDTEFIKYGDNIMLGQGAIVCSSMIVSDYLLIKKVIIGDHVVLGGNSIVAPGTVIGKNCTLGVWAVTHINQILKPNWIYVGRPARKYIPVEKNIQQSKKAPTRRIVDTGEREPYNG
jgi:acetyltransferase-like isoleucine patch superfamily enzyme